jgi:hypothetical protein
MNSIPNVLSDHFPFVILQWRDVPRPSLGTARLSFRFTHILPCLITFREKNAPPALNSARKLTKRLPAPVGRLSNELRNTLGHILCSIGSSLADHCNDLVQSYEIINWIDFSQKLTNAHDYRLNDDHFA